MPSGFISFVFTLFLGAFFFAQPLPLQGAGRMDMRPRLHPAAEDAAGGLEPAAGAGSELFPPGPGSPDANLALGKAAFENRDYETAVRAFQGLLTDSPDRAGEEPAAGSGPLDRPVPQFRETLAHGPNQAGGLDLDSQLRAMRTSKREHFITAKISLGLDLHGQESAEEAPAGTSLSTNLGNMVTITVGRPEKNLSRTSTASVSYLYKPRGSRLSWKMTGTSCNTAYRNDGNLGVNFSDFKAGASFARGRMTWEMYGTSNRLSLEYGRYLHSYGAGSSVDLAVSPGFRLNMDGKVGKKNYFTDDSRDAEKVSVSLSPILTCGRSRLSLSFGLEYENARDDVYTLSRFSSIATYEARLPFSSRVFVSYWHQETAYGDIYPLLGMKKDERTHYVTTGFSRSASLWRSSSGRKAVDLNMNYTYTRAESDIELNTYTRNTLSAGMSMVF